MKKYNVYYATEENAYEIDKHGPMSLDKALETIAGWVEENNEDTDEDEEFFLDKDYIRKSIEIDGSTYTEFPNSHDYTIVVGIAEDGNTEVDDYLEELRDEFIGEFDDEDED